MTKFDLTFTKLSENFGINQNNQNSNQNTTVNQNNNTTNTQTQTPVNQNTSTTPNNNNQTPNLDQLMKDFNDPSKKINSLDDLKNYGIVVDQK